MTATAGVVLGIVYIAAGAVTLKAYPVSLPEPPYGSDTEERERYLSADKAGYRTGIGGVLRTYCFYPEPETQGFYDGLQDGWVVLYRTVGIRSEAEDASILNVMAARDGVTLNTTEDLSNKNPNPSPSSVGSGLD